MVKAVDLRSTGGISAWVRTPLLASSTSFYFQGQLTYDSIALTILRVLFPFLQFDAPNDWSE